MSILIGLTGFAASGKDEFADKLVEEFGYTKVGFADALYKMALWVNPPIGGSTLADVVAELGWTEAKQYPEVREFLQKLGTEGVREILGEDAWVNALMPSVDKMLMDKENVVITNVRFKNEALAILDRDGLLLRVKRHGVGPANSHSSEGGEAFEFSHGTVENNGSKEDLAVAAKEVHLGLSKSSLFPTTADAMITHFLDKVDRCIDDSIESVVKMSMPFSASYRGKRVEIEQMVDMQSRSYSVFVDGSMVGTVMVDDSVIRTEFYVAK